MQFLNKLSFDKVLFIIVIFCVLLSYQQIFSQFFPNKNGGLGHDYAYFLPYLLNGYSWYKVNGFFEVPWFTPAFCGGVPLLPNPQSIYYSIPQILTIFTDPLNSIYLTFLIFALAGFVGFYVLSRNIFQLNKNIALFSATLFLFNGFYTYRMIIGHVTYHSFMLIPLIAYFLLYKYSDKESKTLNETKSIIFSSLLFAYFLYAGALNFIVPAIISIIGIWSIYNCLFKDVGMLFFFRLGVSLLLAALLALSKLTASFLFLDNFPRDLYPLPGIDGIFNSIVVFLYSIFFNGYHALEASSVVNTNIVYGQHAFENSITLVPFIIIIIYIVWFFSDKEKKGINYSNIKIVPILILSFIFILPIIINYFNPFWNSLLKALPYISSSSSLFRWFAINIPLVIVISSLALNSLQTKKKSNFTIYLCIVAIVAINFLQRKDYYHEQYYYSERIIDAYLSIRETDKPEGISYITVSVDTENKIIISPWRNDAIVFGGSQLYCYEPIFGYALESFPKKTLTPGSVFASDNSFFNLKNPACYIYDEVNNCSPGDHFSNEDMEKADRFTNYLPYEFKTTRTQKVMNIINISTISIIILLLLVLFLYKPKSRKS